jgi:predicted SnoaL-like aldol condensation-catalyzing enzyme
MSEVATPRRPSERFQERAVRKEWEAIVMVTSRAAPTAVHPGEETAGAARALVGAEACQEANPALVQRYFDMWNTGASAEADAVLCHTYLDHAHPSVVGPAAVRSLVRRFRADNPEARMGAEIVAYDAEYVVARRTIRWTSGDESKPCGIALFRVGEGQIVEQWSWSPPARPAAAPGPREEWESDAPPRLTDVEPTSVHGADVPDSLVVEFDLENEDASAEARRLPHVRIVRVRGGRIEYVNTRT